MVNDLFKFRVRHITQSYNLKERLNGPQYHKHIGSDLVQLLVAQAQLASIADIATPFLGFFELIE
jgi:hypothetical protein